MAIGWYLNNRRPVDLLATGVTVASCISLPKIGITLFIWVSKPDLPSIFLSIFGTAATLLGFVIAASTFLTAHVRTAEFDILRNSKSYNQLLAIFSSSMYRLALLMFISTVLSRSNAQFAQTSNIIVLSSACYATPAMLILIWATIRILAVGSATAESRR